jgi:ferrous iron transport protein A
MDVGKWTHAIVIDNRSQQAYAILMTLDELPFRMPATVASVDWARLTASEAKRLRNLGLDEGVAVEALHRGPVGRDPLAVRIGRMMVAMRRNHAQAVLVEAR